jgi:DNA-binding response OmpR family regulator
MSKILVIDDDPDLRDTILIMLEEHGHEVVLAEDGECGIVAFAAHRPELVITDIIMPNKSGLDAIKTILERCADARIIVTSGDMKKGDGLRRLMAGSQSNVCCFLPKPFEIEELMQRVNASLTNGPSAA